MLTTTPATVGVLFVTRIAGCFFGLRIVSARYKMAADPVATLREFAVIRKLGAPVSSQTLQFIRDWFETEPGRRLLRRETALIRSQVRRFHGECLLWMGPAPKAVAATARCMIKTRFYLSRDASAARRSELPALIAVPEALPVPSNSVDGVVVHHALEYAEDPRAAIREITRVIRPGGRLLICAFNPLSLWSLRRPRGMTMVTAHRLSDWLAVLGFDREESVLYMNYRASLKLRFDGERWRQVGDWLAEKRVPLGGVYLVLAAKNAAARTGVGPLDPRGGQYRASGNAEADGPPMNASSLVEIFTDGACRGNPGPGGWAALLRCGNRETLVKGAAASSTNNRMELQAAIEGLAALRNPPRRVRLTTDSQYVRMGVTQWIRRWKANGWRTSGRSPVKNRALWERLDALAAMHDVEWLWVKGHSGVEENERVDQAANDAIDGMLDGTCAR